MDPATVVEELARALDRDDFDAVADLLADDCVYEIGDRSHVGPKAISDSYRQGSELANRLFDEVEYGHALIGRTVDTFHMDFADRLTYAGEVLDHHSHQEITVGPGSRIVRIVDITPAEEIAKVNEFMARHRLER